MGKERWVGTGRNAYHRHAPRCALAEPLCGIAPTKAHFATERGDLVDCKRCQKLLKSRKFIQVWNYLRARGVAV